MKAISILILIFLFIATACGTHSSSEKSKNKESLTVSTINKLSIDEFKKMNESKQAEYINNLDEKERIQYVAEFLKDAVIFMPPNDWVKFNKNGDITDYNSISRNTNLGIIGKWKFSDEIIEILAVGDGKAMNDIFDATFFKWKDVKAEALLNTNPVILGLNFDDGYLLQYIKADQ